MEYEIVVDIETLPEGDVPSVDSLTPPGQMKKAETIAKWREEEGAKAAEAEYRKRSLDSMEGRILCIGVAVNDEEPKCFYHETHEYAVLVAFEQYIKSVVGKDPVYQINWIGHNAFKFDMKWIWRHAIMHDLGWIARNIRFERFKGGNISDTMQLWSCGDYKEQYVSLQRLAKKLKVGAKTAGMDGGKVYPLWKEGRHEEIITYNMDDVRLARATYRRVYDILSNMRRA